MEKNNKTIKIQVTNEKKPKKYFIYYLPLNKNTALKHVIVCFIQNSIFEEL